MHSCRINLDLQDVHAQVYVLKPWMLLQMFRSILLCTQKSLKDFQFALWKDGKSLLRLACIWIKDVMMVEQEIGNRKVRRSNNLDC